MTNLRKISDKQEYEHLNEEDIEELLSIKPEKEKCDICKKAEFKYKCPSCLIKTCSLVCCKQHKISSKCDGKYHHEKYIRSNEMDENFLKKDLTYLHEMIRETDNAKKKLSNLKNQEQLRFKLLKLYSKRLYNVNLKIAPQVMSLHRENLSFYHTKTKRIFWSLALIFCSFGEKYEECRLLLEPCEDDINLSKLMEKQIIDNSKLLIILKERLGHTQINEAIKENKLLAYISNDENPRENAVRQVSWEINLSEAVKDLTITEYPVIKIIFIQDIFLFQEKAKILKRASPGN